MKYFSKKSALLAMVILLVFWINSSKITIFVGNLLTMSDSDCLSEKQLCDHIQRIARSYKPSKEVHCSSLYKDEDLSWYWYDENQGEVGQLEENQRIMYISGGDLAYGSDDPIEVYGIFNCYLFLDNQAYDIDIVAIAWHYSSGGWNNNRYQITSITPEVFQDLYNRVDIAGLTLEEAAERLGNQWIQETGFEKWL